MEKQTKIGLHIIIENDKREILLCKRNKKLGFGEWELPGGHLEFREAFENCLERESREELGIKIKVGKLVSISTNMKYGNHYIIFAFLAKSYIGKPENTEPGEHSEIKWFKLSKLPKKLFISTKYSLENYKSKITYKARNSLL